MARTSQSTVGGNCCGACAASYVVEDLLNMPAFSVHDIVEVWREIAFDPGANNRNLRTGKRLNVGGFPHPDIQCEHADPTKLAHFLRTYGKLYAKPYIMPSSPLFGLLGAGILGYPGDVVKGADCMCLLPSASEWRAIGVFRTPFGLHYLAIKADDTTHYYIDSNDPAPDWTAVGGKISPGATWSNYTYLVAAVLVHR